MRELGSEARLPLAPAQSSTAAIDAAFGSMDGFKEKFAAAGAGRFGSGWAWLCKMPDGKVAICSTPNQDNPLMKGISDCTGSPILGCDVWEHAYYLDFKNVRPNYLQFLMNHLNQQNHLNLNYLMNLKYLHHQIHLKYQLYL
jgi:Fe-Mn family superoxide dismutase